MNKTKLTKAEIIESIHDRLNLGRPDIHSVIDAVFDEIKEALLREEVIELRGFGTFEVKTRKGRAKARNPKTGEIVSVGAHGVAAFRPGKELKEQIWDLRK